MFFSILCEPRKGIDTNLLTQVQSQEFNFYKFNLTSMVKSSHTNLYFKETYYSVLGLCGGSLRIPRIPSDNLYSSRVSVIRPPKGATKQQKKKKLKHALD